MISKPLLYTIILVEGFVSVAVEILAIRQLMPFAGNSVIITSLIIGIFLLFLAIGYLLGGRITENYLRQLQTNFIKAAILIGIGLSYVFVMAFFQIAERYGPHYVLVNVTLYLLIVIAPAVYYLGQTVPITTNLFKQQYNIGFISGTALYFSTLGSFAGAILTSLLLFNYLGVGWTVFINYALLLLLIVLLHDWKEIAYTKLAVAFFLAYVCFIINVESESHWFVTTNNYANYQVIKHYSSDKKSFIKYLARNNSVSSSITQDKKAAAYVEYIKRILFKDLKVTDEDILVLGAGGFTLSAEKTNNNHFTYVDIDKSIKDIVEKNFNADTNGEFVAEDARVFLKKTDSKYDVIIADAFKSWRSTPAYLQSQEFIKQIRHTLKPTGIAIFNLIINPMLTDNYSKRVDNTISSVFHNCSKVPFHYTEHPSNVIYICNKSHNEDDHFIYTDELNRASLDFYTEFMNEK